MRNDWISCYFFHQELEAERQARCKAEKQRGTLARELDDLGDRLEVRSTYELVFILSSYRRLVERLLPSQS